MHRQTDLVRSISDDLKGRFPSRQDYQPIPDPEEIEGQGSSLLENKPEFTFKSWKYFQNAFCLLMIPLMLFSLYTIFLLSRGELASASALNSLLNNGTHDFKPTVIMISLDGFRSDYLDLGLTPNLGRIIGGGSRAKFMIPSFPTITFPNHYTIATGLYPDSHGIVGNTFFDSSLNKSFNYKTHISNLEPEWWGGEPIWSSVEFQGQHSAVHMWPGSEVPHGNRMSSYLQPFDRGFKLEDKARQILGWLDLQFSKRPTFLGAYMFDVDTAGHDFGPNSTETRQAIVRVDNVLGILLDGLSARNLDDIVNVIVVSDHGMAEVVLDRVIHLDDYIDMDLIASHHVFPYAGLIPKNEDDIELIYSQLKNASRSSSHWTVYKKADIPERFHYGHNPRVPPIFCIQESGWAFATRKDYPHFEQYSDVQGLHGYDNLHPDMRAIFLAKGPAFRKEAIIQPFQNVEVYNLVCHLLGVKPAVNNGTSLFWKDKLLTR